KNYQEAMEECYIAKKIIEDKNGKSTDPVGSAELNYLIAMCLFHRDNNLVNSFMYFDKIFANISQYSDSNSEILLYYLEEILRVCRINDKTDNGMYEKYCYYFGQFLTRFKLTAEDKALAETYIDILFRLYKFNDLKSFLVLYNFDKPDDYVEIATKLAVEKQFALALSTLDRVFRLDHDNEKAIQLKERIDNASKAEYGGHDNKNVFKNIKCSAASVGSKNPRSDVMELLFELLAF
ncbi:MAG: hypothetical protein JXA66_00145, partial [Oligoflexia bacterium]|nr:hypothetical protein [Oligoflexia bacterium]